MPKGFVPVPSGIAAVMTVSLGHAAPSRSSASEKTSVQVRALQADLLRPVSTSNGPIP